MKRFCLIGKNIDYSLSPTIHNTHFQKNKFDAIYTIFNISSIDKEIDKIRHHSGFNVTIPYKETIIEYCDVIDSEAEAIHAVNCCKVINQKIYGYNTDVYGFYQLLKENHIMQDRKKVLIIGAGGASKAVYYCLNKFFNHNITITNRTLERAKKITLDYIDLKEAEKTLDFYDIIINCTNVGVKDYESPIKIHKIKREAVFIDINYGNNLKFLNDAKVLGAKVVNGMDMLLYQAKKSFEIWFDTNGSIEIMRESIRKDM